jgi:hypothetical protein
MIEEDIKDEGDATTLDHARMVDDIETLDFSSDLIGILRQLVGVDLLRENEIFFLPLPGESYRRKRHGKTKLYVARPPSGDLTLGLQSMATSPRGSATSKLPPNLSLAQTPVSGAGSPSTSTGSTGWNGREIDRHSPSAVSYSDDEAIQADDIGGSQTKRRKAIFSKENGVASSEEMPPPSLTVQTKSSPVRRRSKVKPIKRLSIDTHAYKPEPEAEGTATDHDSDTTKQGKKSGRRGIKRNRTSEVVGADGGPEQPVTKRLRARLSTSANGGRWHDVLSRLILDMFDWVFSITSYFADCSLVFKVESIRLLDSFGLVMLFAVKVCPSFSICQLIDGPYAKCPVRSSP